MQSPTCLRELATARKLGKPLVVLREADPRHGGLSAAALRAEVALFSARKGAALRDEVAALKWLIEAEPEWLEWHREKQLKYTLPWLQPLSYCPLATAP